MTRRDQRFDSRTREQFTEDIRVYTRREGKLFSLFVEELKFLGLDPRVSDHGVDNSGDFVEKPTRAADFRVTFGGQHYLCELKIAPSKKYATFKIEDLRSYIRQGAYILLFLSPRQFLDRSEESLSREREFLLWDLVSPDIIARILAERPHFHFAGLGGKLSVQVPQKEFSTYFNFRPLRHLQRS